MPRFQTALVALLFSLLGVGASQGHAQWNVRMPGPTSVAFSPDGRLLAAGSVENWISPGDLRLWEVKTGKQLHRVRYVYGVKDLAFSPDGKTLAIATDPLDQGRGPIRLWNLRSWHVDRILGDWQFVRSIAFSSDGRRLAAGGDIAETGDTNDAFWWKFSTKRVHELPDSNGLAAVHFSPRNNLLVGSYPGYSGESGSVRAWNGSGRLLWRHDIAKLSGLAFTPNGHTFLVSLARFEENEKPAGGLQIRRTSDGRLLQVIKREENIISLAISHDGRTWATGDDHNTVHLWNARTRRVIKTLRMPQESITALAFSPNNRYLAIAGDSNAPYGGSIHLVALR